MYTFYHTLLSSVLQGGEGESDLREHTLLKYLQDIIFNLLSATPTVRSALQLPIPMSSNDTSAASFYVQVSTFRETKEWNKKTPPIYRYLCNIHTPHGSSNPYTSKYQFWYIVKKPSLVHFTSVSHKDYTDVEQAPWEGVVGSV